MTRTTSARRILSSVLSFNKYLLIKMQLVRLNKKYYQMIQNGLKTNVHLQAMCTNSPAFSRISELPTVLPADPAMKNVGSTSFDLPSLHDGRISGKQDMTPCNTELMRNRVTFRCSFSSPAKGEKQTNYQVGLT